MYVFKINHRRNYFDIAELDELFMAEFSGWVGFFYENFELGFIEVDETLMLCRKTILEWVKNKLKVTDGQLTRSDKDILEGKCVRQWFETFLLDEKMITFCLKEN